MDIKFRNNSIKLIGDLHNVRLAYGLLKIHQEWEDVDIFQIGDLGAGFSTQLLDERALGLINTVCKSRNINFYAIRGNHDDPTLFQSNFSLSNLFLLPDYSTGTFPNGKTALLVGGGISIDRIARIEGKDYWKDEATTYHKTEKKFDILFSHDAPEYFNFSTDSLRCSHLKDYLLKDKTLLSDCLNQRNIINNIVADIECEYVCGGHFHNSLFQEKNGICYRCANINEVVDFDANNIYNSLTL